MWRGRQIETLLTEVKKVKMELYGYEFIRESDLTHHGIQGQKWGQRRFQNEDGTWTAAGKERYGDGGSTGSGCGSVHSFKGNLHRALAANYGLNAKAYSKSNKTLASINKQAQNAQLKKAAEADAAKAKKMNDPEHQKKVANLKKAAKIGAAVAGTALVAYGGYKLNKVLNEKTSMHYRELGSKYADKSMKAQLRAAAFDMGGRPTNQSIGQKDSTFERRLAKDYLSTARQYNQKAHQGSYSLSEKVDTIKRMARRR